MTTVLFSSVEDVSASIEQGDLGQSRVKLVLSYSAPSKNKNIFEIPLCLVKCQVMIIKD